MSLDRLALVTSGACIPVSYGSVTTGERFLGRISLPVQCTDSRLKRTPAYLLDLERWPSGRLQVWHKTGGWPLKGLMDAIFALLLCHSPVTSISQKEVYTFIWHPNFVAPLDCLDLVTSRANAVVPQDYIYLHTLKAALRGSDFQVSESRC